MKSATLPSFWKCHRNLPDHVKKAARKAYRRWRREPFHPSLRFKCIDSKEQIWSVRMTIGYRAIGIMEGDTLTWFWSGSHADYDKFFK